MAASPTFIVNSEADCERVSKVFCKWLQKDHIFLKKEVILRTNNASWAEHFASIYSDTVFNYDLTEKAEKNVINVTFEPMDDSLTDEQKEDLETKGWIELDYTEEELSEDIQDLLDSLSELEDEEEDEKDNDDDA